MDRSLDTLDLAPTHVEITEPVERDALVMRAAPIPSRLRTRRHIAGSDATNATTSHCRALGVTPATGHNALLHHPGPGHQDRERHGNVGQRL
jgi:hypothetical protein